MTFGVFVPPFRPAFGLAAAPTPPAGDWWTAGGAPTPIAVYQPKGAASLAASYTNLVNPGTYDAAPGSAPTWASGTGWTFSGTEYLIGIVPGDTSWTLLVRFASVGGSGARGLVGMYAPGARSAFLAQINTSVMDAYNGADYPTGLLSVSPTMTAGVYGFASKTAYRDGVSDGTIPAGSLRSALACYIGAININGSPGNYMSGAIVAVVIYSATLTAGEVATVSAAMAAL